MKHYIMKCRFWTDKLRVLAPWNRPRNFRNFSRLVEGAAVYDINAGMTINLIKLPTLCCPVEESHGNLLLFILLPA